MGQPSQALLNTLKSPTTSGLSSGGTQPSAALLATISKQPSTTTPAQSLGSSVWSFVKNLPTTIARTVTAPVSLVSQLGASIGDLGYLLTSGQKATPAIPPTGGTTAQQFARGFQSDVTLPFQDTPVLRGVRQGESARQTFGLGAESALNIGLMFAGAPGAGTIAESAAKEVATRGASTFAKDLGIGVAKRVAVDFPLGAAFGAAQTAQTNKPTANDYLHAMLIGGTVATIAPPIIGGTLKGLGAAGGALTRTASPMINNLIDTAEKYAISEKKIGVLPDRVYEPQVAAEQSLSQKIAGKAAATARAVQNIPVQLKTRFVDKYAPLQDLTTKANEAGIPTQDLQDLAQGLKGRAQGTAEINVGDYIGIVKKYGDTWPYVKELAKYMDAMDRLQTDKAVEGGHTVEDIGKAMNAMQHQLTPEQWRAATDGIKELQDFYDARLKEGVDSGQLSPTQYDQIKAQHPNYIPHSVLDYQEQPTPGMGKSMNMPSTTFKKAVGSTRAIADQDVATIQYLLKNALGNEKNQATKAVIDTGSLVHGDSFVPLNGREIKPVDIPKGFEKVAFFRNGAKEEWLIPQIYGDAIKNLDSSGATALSRVLSETPVGRALTLPARIIRSLLTTKNPAFALVTNPARDLQTAQVTGRFGVKDLVTGIASAISGGKGQADELYKLAQKEGGMQGSVYREFTKPEQVLKEKMTQAGLIPRPLSSKLNPARYIEAIGQSAETGVRLTAFKRALDSGMSPRDAAKVMRNVTVDFTKSGTWVETANKVIPFLNARVQGFANLGKAIADHPVETTRRLMWTAAYPTMVLTAYNSRFDAYKNIPDSDKRKYWIIMTGQIDGRDYNNRPIKVPLYVTIAKGEAQQAVSNVIERVLTIGKEKYPSTTNQFIGNLIQDTSPVTESSIIPTGFQQWIETATNHSFFRNAPIVPDYVKVGRKYYPSADISPKYQATSSTSEVAKAVGEALNYPPAKVDYLIKTGVLTDVVKSLDLAKNGFQKKTPVEKASELPVLRSLFRTSSYGQYLKQKDFEQRKLQQKNDKQIQRVQNRVQLPSQDNLLPSQRAQ